MIAVNSNRQAYSKTDASHLPRTISISRIGEVASNSIVPLRFYSANSRMVIMGMKNNPMTAMFDRSGRIICSFRFIG